MDRFSTKKKKKTYGYCDFAVIARELCPVNLFMPVVLNFEPRNGTRPPRHVQCWSCLDPRCNTVCSKLHCSTSMMESLIWWCNIYTFSSEDLLLFSFYHLKWMVITMDNCFKKGLRTWMPVFVSCCCYSNHFSLLASLSGFEMNKDADKFADGPRHITKAESANSSCKSRWIVGFHSIQAKAIQASPLSLEQPKLLSSPA
jgi:hypothetical protein